MKLLLVIAALGCAIIALIAALTAGTVLGLGALGWVAASLVSNFAAILAGTTPPGTLP